MKKIYSLKGVIGLALALTVWQADAIVVEYNIDKRAIDEHGHQLPSEVDISTYQFTGLDKEGNPVSKYFNDYLSARGNTDTAIKIIAKTGPIFGKVTGKLAGPAVNAAVVAETGSKGAGAAAQKITQEGLAILGKGLAKLVESKAFGLALYKSEQGWNSDRHGHYFHEIKPGMAKCRDLKSMSGKNREHLTQDNPKPILIAVYSRKPITATVNGNKVVTKNFQLLSHKWIYPMGPNPEKLQFFKGPLRVAKDASGKTITNPNTSKPALDGARGGAFGSYSITTRYQTTPIYVEKTAIDASGNKKVTMVPATDEKTGEQLIDVRLVADFDLMKLRGGTVCATGGKNELLNGKTPVENNDFYPTGKLDADTTKETLESK